MKKVKQKKDQNKIIIILLFILSAFLLALYITKPVYNCPGLENTALLDLELNRWARDINNESIMFFDYFIYNYGKSPAKNIRVKCNLYDSEQKNILSSTIDEIENIDEFSISFEGVSTKNIAESGKSYIPVCFIESCENCELLYKRIPSLKDQYENN